MDKKRNLHLSPNLQNKMKGETKDKFDALLKQALNLKSRKNAHNRSTQKLISDVESSTNSTENLTGKSNISLQKQSRLKEIVQVDVHGDFEQDNFILNKFLNDSSNLRADTRVTDDVKEPSEIVSVDVCDTDVTLTKPVPQPRKSKKAPLISSVSTSTADTYKNISPTATKSEVELKTLNQSKTLLPVKDLESDESANTYVLETTTDLDASQIKKVSRDSQILTSDPVNIESSTSQSSDNTANDRTTPKSKPIYSEASDRNSEKSELINFRNARIKYENEINPKRKAKQSLKHQPKHQSTFREVVETVIQDKKETRYTYENITGIVIHKTDRLQLDSLVIHPVVKIHLVDSETGNYLTKSDKNRSVVFYYENKATAYITPVISEPYNLYEKCTLQPAWEETLLINEDINFIAANENTIIFFEILDFVSFSVASSQFNQKDSSRGWHKIAWAFFKPVGKHNALNINKKARLQLYYPGKHKKVPPHVCEIFHWWSKNKMIKYPASLYVSVISVRPPDEVTETLRSKTPIHGEKASKTILETHENSEIYQNFQAKSVCSDKIDEKSSTNQGSEVVWSRMNYQICKLPNKLAAKLPSYEEGCLTMKFSHSGLYLACAILIDDVYSLIVFSVTLHKEVCRYPAHQGLIYDIDWSVDDELIITASADCTVCVWNFVCSTFVDMLPHPSYVYASAISSKNIIATGCYDQIVRIWCRAGIETSHDLVQELEQHRSYVTSLCFNKKSTLLYSSDAAGVIIKWKYNTTGNSWNLKREFKLADLKDTIINQILLHTKERRLLIHARDSALRIIDIKTGCVLYWLQGAVNTRFKTTCTFSSCGSFVLAGSENGLVSVWNSDLGQHVATYTPYDDFNYHNFPVHCVQFHPFDNILAISHYGHSLPILLAVYNFDLDSESDVGLKVLHNDNEARGLRKRSSSKPLNDFKLAVEKVTEEDGDDEKRHRKTKFEDVIQKIDYIVSRSRSTISASSKSSFNN